ncbi:hypothetical protein yruck0001_5030 [Yersinia ruckeri ATCC 29473]|nr:hypothetical protein yruck0001_5030 [Yersinia ruckeri ATCC 29473]
MRGGEIVEGKASDLLLRKHVEYLIIEESGKIRELRLDHIASFSHPEIGTVVVSAS